jgi:hypothetical protein
LSTIPSSCADSFQALEHDGSIEIAGVAATVGSR